MNELRKCCGVDPIIVIEYYPGTTYKLRRLRCPICGIQTGAKRMYMSAVEEWNNPENVHLN